MEGDIVPGVSATPPLIREDAHAAWGLAQDKRDEPGVPNSKGKVKQPTRDGATQLLLACFISALPA
jgi:hypothetical protein